MGKTMMNFNKKEYMEEDENYGDDDDFEKEDKND
jgi:hypothetical protein